VWLVEGSQYDLARSRSNTMVGGALLVVSSQFLAAADCRPNPRTKRQQVSGR